MYVAKMLAAKIPNEGSERGLFHNKADNTVPAPDSELGCGLAPLRLERPRGPSRDRSPAPATPGEGERVRCFWSWVPSGLKTPSRVRGRAGGAGGSACDVGSLGARGGRPGGDTHADPLPPSPPLGCSQVLGLPPQDALGPGMLRAWPVPRSPPPADLGVLGSNQVPGWAFRPPERDLLLEVTTQFQRWQNWPHEQLQRSLRCTEAWALGLRPPPALAPGVFSAAVTCVRVHQDFSLFWVTLLPHARLFPGLGLGRGLWLGPWTLRIWKESEGRRTE